MLIVEESRKYAESLFNKVDKKKLSYHNWKHTRNVFNAASLIAEHTDNVNEEERELLQIAALFHDVGYLITPENHEARSAKIAEEFLQKHELDQKSIDTVKQLILATKLGHTPANILEKVIMDADLSHLGRADYIETTYLFLSKEMSDQMNQSLTAKDWALKCVDFLSNHKFQTPYAEELYGKAKQENLKKVKKIVGGELEAPVLENEKKKKGKNKKPEQIKGVETMFRTSLRNHVNLSRIADNKANTLISVNAIIISIVLSTLFPKLDSNPFLFYPSVCILIASFITIFLSILSTIPNVTRGLIGRDEVMEEKGNLLFFGNFHKMKVDDYEWSMNKLMNSKDYIYGSLTRDLFFLGKVLHKKYRLLRWAYYIFLVGLLTSIFVFVINVMPYIGTTTG